jgi:hypothetical protein
MAISTEIHYESVDQLFLDPKNPRLGRHRIAAGLNQENLLEVMRTWTLEELAWSYLQSGGFWAHEALIVVMETLEGRERRVVVEGNRRLAALKLLQLAYHKKPVSSKWIAMIQDSQVPRNLFARVPYLLADSRNDVQAFLESGARDRVSAVVPGTKAGPMASVTSPEGGRPLAPARALGPHAHHTLDRSAKGAFFVVPVEGEPAARGAWHLAGSPQLRENR